MPDAFPQVQTPATYPTTAAPTDNAPALTDSLYGWDGAAKSFPIANVLALLNATQAPQATPAAGDTVFGLQGGAQKTFALSDIIGLKSAFPGGRLGSSSTDPWGRQSNASVGTLYYLPAVHDTIDLYDSSNAKWVSRSIGDSGVSLSLTGLLSSGSGYDVFAYWTGSAVALELGTAWATNTAGACARAATSDIAFQDGRVVKKTGASTYDKTRRLLGSIRAIGTGTTQDNDAKRFISNAYNRIPLRLVRIESTASWTYSTNASYQQANASASNQVEWCSCLPAAYEVRLIVHAYSTVVGVSQHGIGINGLTPANSIDFYLTHWFPSTAIASGSFAYGNTCVFGYNYATWIEKGCGSGTTTHYGGTNAERLSGTVFG